MNAPIRRPDPLAPALAAVDVVSVARADYDTRRALDDAEISRMVREPWRIAQAMYGMDTGASFWRNVDDAAEALVECRRRLASELARKAARHWTWREGAPNSEIALRQAEAALMRIITSEAAHA